MRAADGVTAVPLGSFAGVPVRAHWSVLFTALLVAEVLAANVLPSEVTGRSTAAYWSAGAIGAVFFLGSVLAHEMMHAVAARHYGVPVERITLWLLGGMAEIKGEPPSPRAAATIAGAGPATSIAVGVAFGLAGWVADTLGLPMLITATLLWLAVTNGILGVFNLLPGSPLDGGRLLQALLWRHYGNSYRATRTAARVGRHLGVAFVGVGVLELFAVDVLGGVWLAFIGIFLINASRAESTAAAIRAVLPNMTLGRLMRPLPLPAPSWWTGDQLRAARSPGELLHEPVPVVDFDGRGLGVVSWQDIPLRSGDGAAGTLGAVCRRLPVLPADRSALQALQEGAFARGAVLVHGPDGFGLVTADDLERAAEGGAATAAQR